MLFLCFKNCSQYLGSTFSQHGTLFSSSRKLNYFKLLATSAFLKPKKLLCLFHVSFLDFLFLFLSADHSQVDLSCPAFFPKFRLRHTRDHGPRAPAPPQGPHPHRPLPNQFILHNSLSHWNQHTSKHPGSEPGGKPTLHPPN